jgi:hypothetical protein
MGYSLTVYEVFRAKKNIKDWTQWQKDNPEAFDIFDEVSRMRDATD